MSIRAAAKVAADTIAENLASPTEVRRLTLAHGWAPQSLAHGAVGVALLHIERARTGDGPWQRAHDWLACAAARPVVGAGHLFYGAPALAFAMSCAAVDGRYARALDALDRHITATTQQRVSQAHARMDRGEAPALAEFDAIRGMSGLAAYLLRRNPDHASTRGVVEYLVRLTEPLPRVNRTLPEALPGWWSPLAPTGKPSPNFPEGHANAGVAHGIGGVLAALSAATRTGVRVDGLPTAIGRILAWLDRWRQDAETGSWWPYWITPAQQRIGSPGEGPQRPSWCYGTAGLARAQQLAALATGDADRRRAAETALLKAVTDPAQTAQITSQSLCHGTAGLAHIAQRVAVDSAEPHLRRALMTRAFELLAPLTDTPAQALAADLLRTPDGPGDVGLLDGAAGVALALHSISTAAPPASGWDACLQLH
ncbi:lanthionine synthetase C family protein [Yinghuangia sp. ASG 101]|uniref:lanthionine synthetase C family protein n=1 Tax=Yinghuangia sp. ASG 101 TaxID=2896848 RepID=UPI001E532880|nr:lanthionine synthetase C family protein [Yinghuangia sp. ASG 101]UGQ13569.1 lanthionine synthetase C family protein [Yinghuangia sp. ASG 101]